MQHIPINLKAVIAFDEVCESIGREPEKYNYHATFIKRNDTQIKVGEALELNQPLAPDANSSPHATELSFSSEATAADEDVDLMNEPIWTGRYQFSLDQRPELPKIGWRAGYGRNWNSDPKGCTELLLAMRDTAQQYRVHGTHVLFNVLADSGAFGIRSPHPDGRTRVGTTAVNSKNGFIVLINEKQIVEIGDLQYELRFTVDPKHESAFQAEKSQYMIDILFMETPISHTLITPSAYDVTIGKWKLRKAAGAGSSSVIKAAINDSNKLVAVRTLTGGVKVYYDAELAKIRQLDRRLDGVQYSDKVLRLHEIIQPPDGDERNDTYVLFTPLARGDLVTKVLKDLDHFPKSTREQIFAQMIAGVAALHQAKFVHYDISPKNIGIRSLKPVTVVILDLASAWDVGDYHSHGIPTTPGHGGTPGFLAPEREVSDSWFGMPSDMWSVGCIGFDLFRGGRRWAKQAGWATKVGNPWREPLAMSPSDAKDHISDYGYHHERLSACKPDSIERLLARLLTLDPGQRATVQEALQHPCVKDNIEPATDANVGEKRSRSLQHT
ncbi:Protein kinase [Vermiconidia calcicola]|uniref:Protein kinase n=1 Tax=Vermiconidia calcicola TaxID=1690605 RepID=A0ACC3NAT4_9PEZI|nr:Protein kinase [Vermiconidia calcicola]